MINQIKTLILLIITIVLFQGCNIIDPTCNTQQCTNGVITFKLCRRDGNQNIILTDESGKALLCNKNK